MLYILERFLYRLSVSTHRDRLVLKGGMLLAVFDERRPTADVDLLAQRVTNNVEAVAGLVREIVAVEVDDGVVFDPSKLRAQVIREADLYTGVRIVVPAGVARSRHPLRVDVNVGDPVTPAPVEVTYPALLAEPFTVVGYPLETVLAEKIVTMVDSGDATTRERDFADVFVLTKRYAVRRGRACCGRARDRSPPPLRPATPANGARHAGRYETVRLGAVREPQRSR